MSSRPDGGCSRTRVGFRRAAVVALAFGCLGAVAVTTARAQTQPLTLDQQIQVLIAEKLGRTDAQKKIDSQLLLVMHPEKFWQLPLLMNKPQPKDGYYSIKLDLVPGLPNVAVTIRTLLGLLNLFDIPQPVFSTLGDGSIQLKVPPSQLVAVLEQTMATQPDVRLISPALPPMHNKNTSEGDVTHKAADARTKWSKNGTGQKVCVISDGIDGKDGLVGSGDLPSNIQILNNNLNNEAGSGNEGTAMLEIVYDLAPGATLGFATSNGGEAQFAKNILDLGDPAKGNCNIIVDDTDYATESPFQDGVIANAVNTVTASPNNVLYFSSAGNSGNLESQMSGTWEGDFNASHNVLLPANHAYVMHEWQSASVNPPTSNTTTSSNTNRLFMHWAEPAGKSGIDYDFYLMDASGKNILAFSTNTQNGTQNAFEYTEGVSNFPSGSKIIVVKPVGKEDRIFNIQWYRGTLGYSTSGATRGHSAAVNALSVAATPAIGPYPNAFDSTAKVEWFSSDGPRRIFFDSNGNLLPGAPANNFKSTGGVVRSKPDITAADGVSTDTLGFYSFSGTSAAAPHAAAIAALVRQANPGATTTQLRSKLIGAAVPINNTAVSRGAGVLMASLALQPAIVGPLDIDGNGQIDASTDGILILRWLFGLTGSPLTSGAIGVGAQRSSPTDVLAYLESKRALFDVDNNGKVEALSDALMLMRYLFGLRQTALVAGAIGIGAQRDASAIATYIATLMAP